MSRPNQTGRSVLVDLLAQLVEHEPPLLHWQRFADTEHADDFEHLVSMGILRHIGNTGSIYCHVCDTLHSARVELFQESRYQVYCPDVGYYDIDSSHLRVFKPDLAAMTNKMARGLGFLARTPPREVVAELLYDLGERRFGPYASRVYFARRLDQKTEFDRIHAALAQVSDRSPALILSTTACDQIAATRPTRHAMLWLPDVATFSDEAMSFDEGQFLAKLRGDCAAFKTGDNIGYAFSRGFRSAVFGDREYRFTKKQAEAVEHLFDAFRSGPRPLHQDEIKGLLNTNQRMVQLFRNGKQRHPAYGTLIKYDREGYYWLEL